MSRLRALAALREVAANRSLRRVELSWALGTAADQAFLVVALVVGYQAAGVVSVTLVGLARTIPALVVALAVDVERRSGPAVMLGIANGMRALAAAGIAALVMAGAPGSRSWSGSRSGRLPACSLGPPQTRCARRSPRARRSWWRRTSPRARARAPARSQGRCSPAWG